MTEMPEEFIVGIEEEYLLIDPATRDLVADPSDDVLKDCEAAIHPDIGGVRPEFLRAQIEVGTAVCHSIDEARSQLLTLRRTVKEFAESHRIKIIATSTHSFANWSSQRHTDKDRFNVLAQDMQVLANRHMICGMHVHVGFENSEYRIDLLNRIPYFLPHILALTTTSPFWQGRNTGLKSYRISVFDELPRTGLPKKFDSYGEYERHVCMLVDAGLVEDSLGCEPARNIPDLGNGDRRYLYADGRWYHDCGNLRIPVGHAETPSARKPAVKSVLKHVGA